MSGGLFLDGGHWWGREKTWVGVLGAAPRRMGCGANEVATRGKAFPLLIKNKKSDIMKLWKVTRKNLLILWLIARF